MKEIIICRKLSRLEGEKHFGDVRLAMSNKCYVVIDGYHGDDGYIDGTIRIFSTRQKAEEFIKKYKEIMKRGKRPGDKFSDYYDSQTIMEVDIE